MAPERTTHSGLLGPLAGRLTGALAVAVGGLALVGWAFDIALLKSVLPGWVSMKPNTALCFVLVGLALLFAPGAAAFRLQPSAFSSRLCALLAGVIGLLTLAEYTFGWNPGFDQWLFPEPAGAVGTSNPGRMAPDTALCFVLFAVGFEFARRPRQTTGGLLASVLFGSAIATVAIIEILSYFTPTLRTYGWGGLTMMALPTALVFAAVGAALVGSAVWRKTSSPDGSAQPFAPFDDPTVLRFLLIFAGLAVGIIAAGIFYYRNLERKFRADAEQQLSAIADLKVGELMRFRQERLVDAAIFHHNPILTQLARRSLASPADADALRQLQAWLGKYQTEGPYDRVFLLDAQGGVRLSLPASAVPVAAIILARAAEVLRSGQLAFQDFFRHELSQRIYLALLIPLYDEADGNRPLGVLVLRIDPANYLYPFINRWPVPSATAETLLARREGNEVVFLNELRFEKNTTLVRHVSLAITTMPVVKAALGQEGTVDGFDYRGVPVLAALRAIPDSPWFIVARQDVTEVYASLRSQVWQVIALVSVLLFGAGAGVGFVWRQQRVRFYRERAEVTEAVKQEQALNNTIIESIPGTFYMLDETGKYVRWSAYQRDEIVGKPDNEVAQTSAIDTIHPDDRACVGTRIGNVLKNGVAETVEGRVLLRGGPAFQWLLMTGRRIIFNDRPFLVGIGIDITARKQAEERLRIQAEQLAKSNAELIRFNRLMTGRELRTIELKQQVNDLAAQLGQSRPYPLAFLDAAAAEVVRTTPKPGEQDSRILEAPKGTSP
jgi:PAS domain S-box-containing protein